jgi:hypothetical protein
MKTVCQLRPARRLRSLFVVLLPLAAAAQSLVRETPTTLVLPIPGTGSPGAVPGTGVGSVGTVLPAALSQTGAFTDLIRMTPTRGLVPYEPNAVLWSDHAKKTRWFALNSATTTMGFRRDARWTIPVGAVWVKHFELELRRGDPTSLRRVETRFLVRSPNDAEGRVTGYTYRWNDAQTDATLVPMGGATQVFQVTENGVIRDQTWTFPARLDCQTCHNSVGGPILSFSTRQMNRPGRDGTNQIVALARAGYLDVSSVPEPSSLPALVDATDVTQPLEQRVRSYLDVNCSQCHRPGTSEAGAFDLLLDPGQFDTRATTPLSLAGIIDGALRFGVADPSHRVVVAGDAARSQLLSRMATRGPARMPPLATAERDLGAEALIAEWIAALGRPLPASRLINVSARAQTNAASGTLISGFVIPSGAPKTLLVRAVGPTLTRFGVSDAAANPTLTLFDSGSRVIASNTRWNTASNAVEIRSTASRVGGFALADGAADSAVLVSLGGGAYTAHVTAANNENGVVLFEVYDADAGDAAGNRLVNTSIRGLVGVAGRMVIPGLVVSAGATKTMLIRAIGPGLAAHGVAGPLLAAPVLTLYANNEAFISNTRWNTAANAAEIRATTGRVGAFALGEGAADSAMLVNLSPGAYTVQASGANGTAGVVLVEMFEVP